VASANELELVVESLPGSGEVVRVNGELDLGNVSEFKEALTRSSVVGMLVVDLSECSFLDSSAVRVLIEAAAKREGDGRGLVLVAPEGGVRRTLEIVGLDKMLPLHATLSDAAL
jgi:stage II sporulation protein AA (anti-sigma F factor antagonist)